MFCWFGFVLHLSYMYWNIMGLEFEFLVALLVYKVVDFDGKIVML